MENTIPTQEPRQPIPGEDIFNPSPTHKLDEFEQILNDALQIRDWEAIRIILAVVAAHYVPGEPLWVRLVGPSRSGKTEILRAIATYYGDDVENPDIVEMEAITPASIRGGLDYGHRLLDRIKGKMVVTKDIAALLTTRSDSRKEILGLFRNVKDGKLTSDFGTEDGYNVQDSYFDWILATTPAFEQVRVMEDLLGARFIDVIFEPDDRLKIAKKAAENSPKMSAIRENLKNAIKTLLDGVKAKQKIVPALAPDANWIAEIADLAALLRSPVDRDRYHNVNSIPMPEIASDLSQSFTRIAQGLWLLGISDYQPYIWRLAKDCIPSVRRVVLGALLQNQQPLTADEISKITKLPAGTLNLKLEELGLLDVSEKNGYLWSLKPEIRNRLETFQTTPAINPPNFNSTRNLT